MAENGDGRQRPIFALGTPRCCAPHTADYRERCFQASCRRGDRRFEPGVQPVRPSELGGPNWGPILPTFGRASVTLNDPNDRRDPKLTIASAAVRNLGGQAARDS